MNKEAKKTEKTKAEETKKDELFEESTDLMAKGETMPATEIKVQEDLLLPRWQLLQNTSELVQGGGAKAGRIRHSITSEEHEKLMIIPLLRSITRIMFDPENRGGTPLCMSNDGITGNMGLCQDCAEKDFKRSEDKKSVAPGCSKVYNFLTIKADDVGKNTMPTIMSFMKSSSNAGKKILTSSAGWIKPLPIWTFVWEVSVVPKTFSRGPAYILAANQVRETNEKERKFLKEVSARFAKAEIKPEISGSEVEEE